MPMLKMIVQHLGWVQTLEWEWLERSKFPVVLFVSFSLSKQSVKVLVVQVMILEAKDLHCPNQLAEHHSVATFSMHGDSF